MEEEAQQSDSGFRKINVASTTANLAVTRSAVDLMGPGS